MIAKYSEEPKSIENTGLGVWVYRWNIHQVTIEVENPEETEEIADTLWECNQEFFNNVLQESEILDRAKELVLERITEYDASDAVNSFLYGSLKVWLDKSTRVGLMNSTTILKDLGETETTLWLGSFSVTLPVDSVIGMLRILEKYALECYNITAQHKNTVDNMTDIQGILEYDFTQGYPDKPEFEA